MHISHSYIKTFCFNQNYFKQSLVGDNMYSLTYNPFFFKDRMSLCVDNRFICQIPHFQSTYCLNSIVYKRCFVTHDTFSSKRIENLTDGIKDVSTKRENNSLFLNRIVLVPVPKQIIYIANLIFQETTHL